MAVRDYKAMAIGYAEDVTHGRKRAGREVILACFRFLVYLKLEDLELRTAEPNFVLGIVEKTRVHMQGQDLQGNSLMGTPLLLEPWQVFIVYNLVGFYYRGTNERRYKEAFIFIPRH